MKSEGKSDDSIDTEIFHTELNCECLSLADDFHFASIHGSMNKQK